MSNQTSNSTEALPSATVALVRDAASGPELLLVLRHGNTSFGNSFVFPGGLVEAQDFEVERRCCGQTEAGANTLLGIEEGGLAYYSAAIRELFEEAGVLLARDSEGHWVDAEPMGVYRNLLHSGEESWPAFLARYDLTLACDSLNYFAYWITPLGIKKRFTTRFFVAAMPDGQAASHCGIELTDSRWLTGKEALAESSGPDFQLPHPTRVSLQSLGAFDDADGMLGWARQQSEQGVDCNFPVVVSVAGKPTVVMPGDPRYPAADSDNE